jgi:hypothetical protein
MITRNEIIFPNPLKEFSEQLNKNIYEGIKKYNLEVEKPIIIERYKQLQSSFWKRFYFLFTGV